MEFQYITLEEFIKNFIKVPPNLDHIEYDPLLDEDNNILIDCNAPKKHCDVRIIRSVIHDGTYLFTHNIIIDTFLLLINKNLTLKDKNCVPKKYIVSNCRLEHHDTDIINKHNIRLRSKNISCIAVKFIW